MAKREKVVMFCANEKVKTRRREKRQYRISVRYLRAVDSRFAGPRSVATRFYDDFEAYYDKEALKKAMKIARGREILSFQRIIPEIITDLHHLLPKEKSVTRAFSLQR